MDTNGDNSPGQDRSGRVLLLITARTYRVKAFRNAAERLGIEVAAAVDMEEALAQYWNYRLGVNFKDRERAVQTIVQAAAETPFDAIIPVDDSGTDIAAAASEILGLPYNSPVAAKAASDKYIMRSRLKSAGLNVPDFSLHHFSEVSSDRALLEFLSDLAETISYPCILKPPTLSGSRGVIRADSPNEFVDAAVQLWKLLRNLDPSPGPKPFLVEDYIPGQEVALEGILDAGRLKVLALFDKPDPLEGPYFEETLYITPSLLPPEVQDEISRCTESAAEALGLMQGPIHAELRINNQGPWLIEAAGRSIGGLCSNSLRFGLNTSLEELILRQAVGMEIETFEREELASGVLMIPIPQRGILKAVSGVDAARKIPLVESVEITARLNYPLVPLPEGDSYLGFIFARGDDPKRVESALRRAHAALSFSISPDLTIAPGHGQLQFQT